MLRFLFLLLWLKVVSATAGSHSLMALATYIDGQTQFPEFSVVLMLDDLQIGYYGSDTKKIVYRTESDSQYYAEEQNDAKDLFWSMYNRIKNRAFSIKKRFNHTDGIYVHQRINGCQLNNDKPGPVFFRDAFDGQNVEEFVFDKENNVINVKIPWTINWDLNTYVKSLYKTIYQPICIKVLQRYLYQEKNNVMRRVKPRVRLIKKRLSDSKGLQMSCLATGFYPRHINLTLFRDAQPVDDDQMTGGQILPNGDGTYQMRKSLMISEEELREGHQYNCTMKHLNLDNKLDIMFDDSESDPGSSSLSVVISVLVFIVSALIITALIIWWRKRRGQGSETSQSTYSSASSSVQDET